MFIGEWMRIFFQGNLGYCRLLHLPDLKTIPVQIGYFLEPRIQFNYDKLLIAFMACFGILENIYPGLYKTQQ